MNTGVAHLDWLHEQETLAAALRDRQAERIRRQVEIIEAEVRALRAILEEEPEGNDDAPSLSDAR